MIATYLYINSFLYFSFCVWCILKLEGTSRFLGYSFLNHSGKVEYLTIYTGLQAGLAIFLGLAAYHESLRLGGLIFCVSMYGGLILTRTISTLYYRKVDNATYYIGALEYGLGIWGGILIF